MKKSERFTQKLQADIALIEAKLTRFKVRGMGFTAGAKDRHGELVEQLEQKIDRMNERLSDLGKADEQHWSDLKDRIENDWRELQTTFQGFIDTFSADPGVEDFHGNDDGPFPYGKGLSGSSAEKK